MSSADFVLLSASRLAACRKNIEASLALCAQSWELGGGLSLVTCGPVYASDIEDSSVQETIELSPGLLVINDRGVLSDMLIALLGYDIDCREMAGSAYVGEVLRGFLEEALELAPLPDHSKPGSPGTNGCGWLQLELGGVSEHGTLNVWAYSARFEGLVRPVEVGASLTPVSMLSSLQAQPICLKASMPTVELDMATVFSLEPGDVVMLEDGAIDDVRLSQVSGEVLAAGILGQANGALVVRLNEVTSETL